MVFLLIALLSIVSPTHCTNICDRSFGNTDLYPVTEPYNEGYLQVSELHKIYYAEFGNPQGVPVVVLHGGPGGGCDSKLSVFFDLSHYRVVMFDQRGAKRSLPRADMRENTPNHSVRDMEQLREHLNIDKWILFGGSYGTLLALLYGETHPDRVLSFVLRGVFLGMKHEYENLFYHMTKFFPEEWDKVLSFVAPEKRRNIIAALDELVMNPDPAIHQPVSNAFIYYDFISAFLIPDKEKINAILNDGLALDVARAFIHHAANQFFLEDNQILNNIETIADIPTITVQGRYDLICPPDNAYTLHKHLRNDDLWFIPNCGHAASEPSTSQGLKTAMDKMKTQISL